VGAAFDAGAAQFRGSRGIVFARFHGAEQDPGYAGNREHHQNCRQSFFHDRLTSFHSPSECSGIDEWRALNLSYRLLKIPLRDPKKFLTRDILSVLR
jgi:hypothetical protein